jgi:hyaluronan synthase
MGIPSVLVPALAARLTEAERRTDPRRRVELKVALRSHAGPLGAARLCGTVRDLSRGGASLSVDRPVEPGDWLTLELPPRTAPGCPHGRVGARVCRVAESSRDAGYAAGVQFARSPARLARMVIERSAPWAALACLLLVVAAVCLVKRDNVELFWYHPWRNAYGLLVSGYLLSRVVLACFYRAPPDVVGYLPSITVVVVCKNEEPSIFRTLDRIFQADYPAALRQVVAVNDGSTDGTLAEMQRARGRHPSLEIVDFPRNLGKRHGMAAGARRATGDVIVYVDSDSFVRRDALRRIVAGFADPEVGAVCGHARVENAETNLLTRMQEVRYYVAFRVVKAAESLFAAVTCCSGCLAAYRRENVMQFLDVWLRQRFLGRQATFGDDRSLTNHTLRRWKVLYAADAVCTTIVPDRWSVFFRQQLRWKKSWIRESLVGMTFMWRRNPVVAFFFYFGVLFPLLSPAVVAQALVLPLAGLGRFSWEYVAGVTLMSALFGLVYALRHRNRLWVYGIAFSFLYMVALVWQTYWALLTVRRTHWGTR